MGNKVEDYLKEQIAKYGLEKVMQIKRSVEMTEEEIKEQK